MEINMLNILLHFFIQQNSVEWLPYTVLSDGNQRYEPRKMKCSINLTFNQNFAKH